MSKFIALIENKAFVIALLTAIASAAAVFGYNVPVTTILGVIGPIMAILGVQSWQTQSKAQLQMQHDHELKMAQLVSPARDKQAGRSNLGVLFGLAACALLVLAVVRTQAPAPVDNIIDVSEGVALGPTGCGSTPPILTDVIDCVHSEATLVTNGLTVTQVVSAVWGAIASVASQGVGAVIPILESLATKFGPDLVACIVDDYPTEGGGSGSAGSGSGGPVIAAGRFGGAIHPDVKAQLLGKLAPGKKFNHGAAK